MKKLFLLFFVLVCGLHAQTPVRIVAARTAAFTDSKGQVWQPDTGLFSAGTAANCAPTSTTTGTPDPGLYKGARVGAMTYTIPVPNGAYTVNLYFSECYFSAKGQRVFSVKMQGNSVFPAIDIFAAAGRNVAYEQTATPVTVTTGSLAINFVTGAANVPIIDAIEIIPTGHQAALTWADTVNAPGSVTYHVYRIAGPCGGAPYTLLATGLTTMAYIDPTITTGQTYCYQVRAAAPDGTESLPSNTLYVPSNITALTVQ